MFVAVIRGDLAGPLFLADLEPKSTSNPTTEPHAGQARYLSRPDEAKIAAYLASQSLAASASALITATVPVGGPVNVSSATITGVAGLGGASGSQVAAIQALLAAKIVETDVAKKSWLSGVLAGLRSSSFNPDRNRYSNGAAVVVLQDDGSSAFTVAVPTISNADLDTPTSGALRISGTGLLGYGMYETSVTFLGSSTGSPIQKRVTQAQILAAGGSVTATQIDIPASLTAGATVGFTSVRVVTNDLVSNAFVLV